MDRRLESDLIRSLLFFASLSDAHPSTAHKAVNDSLRSTTFHRQFTSEASTTSSKKMASVYDFLRKLLCFGGLHEEDNHIHQRRRRTPVQESQIYPTVYATS